MRQNIANSSKIRVRSGANNVTKQQKNQFRKRRMDIEEISTMPIIGYEITRMNLIENNLTRITKSKKTRNQTKNKNDKNHNETILTYIHITQNKYYTYDMDQKIGRAHV